MFVRKIENRLKLYTGIPEESQNFIDNLVTRSSLEKYIIYLTLYKIKSNKSFQKMANYFSISESHAAALFAQGTLGLAEFMRPLVYWPSFESISRNLPMQFKKPYHNVQSIIDCLEINIQRPGAAIHQVLTWSHRKKCNTMKFLISCTPDGFINFISSGYGGRVSEVAILENCGYLEVLPENCSVMIYRGFKQIETLLNKKNCTLVRPKSVDSNAKMSKNDVLLTELDASVRIHVKRIINQLGDFGILESNSTIPSSLIQMLDNIVMISCAIINIQKPRAKQ
nr:unnamed protein product [Callosobruchus analis]